MLPRLPSSTLFPYTTLFRSDFCARRKPSDLSGDLETQLPAVFQLPVDAPLLCRAPQAVEPCARTRRRSRHAAQPRSEEHTSELQSRQYLVCRLLLEKKKTTK